MGVFDKFLDIMKLNDDDYDDDFYDEEDEYFEQFLPLIGIPDWNIIENF